MFTWRTLGFWPGTALGGSLALCLCAGSLLSYRQLPHPDANKASNGRTSAAVHTGADGQGWNSGNLEGTGPTAPCFCLDAHDTIADQLAARIALATDSTFERLLDRVLADHSNTSGSCCGPVLKYEALGKLLSATDVDLESFSLAVDVFPASAGRLFAPSSLSLSTLYSSILDQSHLLPGAWDVGFSRTKADALRAYDKSSLASDSGPFKYAPALPRPRDWYTDDSYWSAFSMDYHIGPGLPNADTTTTDARPRISFEYCVVGIDRPWFSEALFRSHERWCIDGMAADRFSQKHDLRMYPVAMVVVRNVVVSFHGTPMPATDAPNVTLAPFTRLGGKWKKEDGRLVNPAKQIVAWVCDPLPAVPPLSDPSFAMTGPQ